MIAKWLAAFDRHSRTIEKTFLVVFLALLAYALLNWLGWWPAAHNVQPLRLVLLSAALALQPIAALSRRSRPLFYLLLVASVVLLIASFAVASQQRLLLTAEASGSLSLALFGNGCSRNCPLDSGHRPLREGPSDLRSLRAER